MVVTNLKNWFGGDIKIGWIVEVAYLNKVRKCFEIKVGDLSWDRLVWLNSGRWNVKKVCELSSVFTCFRLCFVVEFIASS